MSGPLQPGTPAGALFDESALPDWLRQAPGGQDVAQQPTTHQPAPGMRPSTGAVGAPPVYGPAAGMGMGMGGYQAQAAPQPQPQLQQRQAAFPSIEQVGAYGAPAPGSSALSGPALIDLSALPAWLGGQAAPPPRGGGVRSTGMPAQALIDESALPNWLRAEPDAAPPAANAAPTPAASPAPGSARLQWAAPTTDEPLPSWLNQVYADANVPRIGTGPMGADAWAAQAPAQAPFGSGTGPTVPDGRRLAASSLMDDTALPDWLKIQGAQSADPANPPASGGLGSWQLNPQPERAAPPYLPGGDQSGSLGAEMGGSHTQFAASDLIDPDAVPSWVRGNAPQQQAFFSSSLGWTSKQPSVSPGSAALRGGNNPPGSGMLDVDAAQHPGTGGFYSGMLSEEVASPWSSRPLEGQGPALGRGQSDHLAYSQSGQLGGYGSGSLEGQQGHRVPREYDHSGLLPDEVADRPSRGSGDLGGPPSRYANSHWDNEPAETASHRRGPPIPFEELPPWLRTGNNARAPEGYRGGAEMGDDYEGDDDGEWWPEDEEQAPQWNDWGDEAAGAEYGSAEYGAAYPEYAQGYDYADERVYRDGDDRKRGGWRRFFGRQ